MMRHEHIHARIKTVVTLALGAALCAPVHGAVLIVEDGRPNASIVIAEAPPRLVDLAARELQT